MLHKVCQTRLASGLCHDSLSRELVHWKVDQRLNLVQDLSVAFSTNQLKLEEVIAKLVVELSVQVHQIGQVLSSLQLYCLTVLFLNEHSVAWIDLAVLHTE